MTTGGFLPTTKQWRCTFSNSSISCGVVGRRQARPEDRGDDLFDALVVDRRPLADIAGRPIEDRVRGDVPAPIVADADRVRSVAGDRRARWLEIDRG